MSSSFEVTTIGGKVLPRNKCRYIQSKYYEIGVDCFLMSDGKWHRMNNGKIEFDHEAQKYVLLENSLLIQGIVGIGTEGRQFSIGYFSPNPSKNVDVSTPDYGTIKCLNEDIPKKCGFEERVDSGIFHKGLSKAELSKKGIGNRYSFGIEYSSAPKIGLFSSSHRENYSKKNDVSSKFFEELDGTSFGFEFETENGYIPERHLFRNGLIPLKDGSLRHDNIEPFEYTTIPLKGAIGLNTLVDTVELLKKHTTIGHKCALHVHLGGFSQDKEMVVATHRLMLRVQDEIYSMFPSNYRWTSKNGFKSKDYCAPIYNVKFSKSDNVDEKFARLFSHYSGGEGRFRGFNVENHPMDRHNDHKWNVNHRYYILNTVPFLWGPTGTFEWRIHPPTQNVDKIINWLFICSSVIRFAEKHRKEIAVDDISLKPFNLKYILQEMYSATLADTLYAYVEERKRMVEKMESAGDIIGDYELKTDQSKVENSIL